MYWHAIQSKYTGKWEKAKLQERIYNIILGSNTSIYVHTLFHVIRIWKKKTARVSSKHVIEESKGGFSFSDQLFSTLSTFFTSVHTLLINESIEVLKSLPSGFPGGSNGECLKCGTPRFDPWVGKISLENGTATHSSILVWRIPWTETRQATVDGVTKSRIQLSY